ncbi:kinase-like protein [Dentipellis sp. KUC8613]|nr:kinase-like protein [Dentipellis sp. KUC8613]
MLSSVARSAFFSINFKSSFNLHPARPDADKPAAPHELLDVSALPVIGHDDAPFLKHLHSGTTLLNPGASPSPRTLSSPFLTADNNASLNAGTSAESSSGTLVAPGPAPLSADEFEPLRLLGEGGFGRVLLVRDRATGRAHALKVVSKARLKPKSHKLVLAEQRVLRAVAGAPGFLQMEASWHDAGSFYFLTDFVPGGTLRTELKRRKRLPPAAARFYTAELLLALERLHAAGIVHRDVKPENILLGADGHVVLADFGLSRVLAPVQRSMGGVGETTPVAGNPAVPLVALGLEPGQDFTRTPCGTMRYMAPEAMFALPYGVAVDVWAMGVVLHVMCCGRVPFGANAGRKEYRQALLNDPLNFLVGEVDPVTQDLLERLLSKNPAKRPKLDEVKKHPFFESIDWDALARKEIPPPFLPPTKPTPNSGSHLKDSHKPRAAPFASPNDDPYPDFAFLAPSFRDGKPGHEPDTFSKDATGPPAPLRQLLALGKGTAPGSGSSASLQWDDARRRVHAFFLGLFRARRAGDAKVRVHGDGNGNGIGQHASSPTVLEAAAGVPSANSWFSVQLFSLDRASPSGHGHALPGADGVPAANMLERVKRWLERRRLWAARARGVGGGVGPAGVAGVAVSEMMVPQHAALEEV